MKITKIDFLIQKGNFGYSSEFESILTEIKNAVVSVNWPEGSDRFTLYPEKKANGVVPIKKNFMNCMPIFFQG